MTRFAAALCYGFVLMLPVSALAQQTGAASLPRAQCLSEQQRANNAKLKALTRPTTKDDPIWVFDPDYFVGTWTTDFNGPETALGATSEIMGTLTIAHVEGCYYEGTFQAKALEGPYSAKVQITFDPDRSWLTWVETDSRGFTIVRSGFMGNDLGGYFTHFWEHAPVFGYQGKKIRLYGNTFVSSPAAFMIRSQISVDGGGYDRMGSLWFRKEMK